MTFKKMITGCSITAISLCVILLATITPASAAEQVKISGFTWPGYGFWFIARDKNLAPNLDIDYQTIEDPYESYNLVTADQMDVVSSTVEFAPIAAERDMPLKLVAFGNLSYGTDKIVAAPGINGPNARAASHSSSARSIETIGPWKDTMPRRARNSAPGVVASAPLATPNDNARAMRRPQV